MPSTEKRLAAVERRLNDVADREAIRELTARYCQQVVRGDLEGIVDLFCEDGSINMGETVNRGRDQLLSSYREALADMSPLPCIHNHVIELDGDRATGVCSVEIRMVQNGEAYTAAGHYNDTYRRVDGAWKFESRDIVMYHMVPLSKGWA